MTIFHVDSTRFNLKVCIFILLCVILLFVLYTSHGTSNESNSLSVGDQYLQFNDGNNVLLFTPSRSIPKWEHVVGKAGKNTLWLRLTENEIQSPLLQGDILRFYYFLLNNSSKTVTTQFTFSAFHLTIVNFENVIVEMVPEAMIKNAQPKILPSFHIIRNSSLDCRS